jgi:16S rRNA (adenine1518-N6/adenine1519-N6)-dimethyltransferase
VGHPVDLPPLDVPQLLRRHNLRPEKRLGQNFLVDPAALNRIVHAAEISAHDFVLEIGAGLGSLTRLLAVRAREVKAIELDARLLPPLREVLAPCPNVDIILGDILEIDPATLLPSDPAVESGYLVVANIPYYITSAVIRHLLSAKVRPRRVVLTVQREVAERICASPGKMSLLALSVQVFGTPRIMARIPAGAFYPAPQVDSAIVRLDLLPEPRIPAPTLDAFFTLARAGFAQKRKTLRNSLVAGLKLPASQVENLLDLAAIEPSRRPETLSLDEWERLVSVYQEETFGEEDRTG